MDVFGKESKTHSTPVVIVGNGPTEQTNGASAKPSESLSSLTAHRRKRLTRSENVCSHHHGWEALFRESLLHMAWPISLSLSADGDSPDFLPLKIR